MQLLKITVIPMQYELEIQPARLEYQQDFTPSADVQTTPGRLQMESQPTQLRLDTYEARKSLGFATSADRSLAAAEKSLTRFFENIRAIVEDGRRMAKIEDGVTVGQLVQGKMLRRPELFTAFLPSGGADISWLPGSLHTSYESGEISLDWQVHDNSMHYIPGSVKMRITQQADVDVKYLGTPMYIPPSADPDYEEPGEKSAVG